MSRSRTKKTSIVKTTEIPVLIDGTEHNWIDIPRVYNVESKIGRWCEENPNEAKDKKQFKKILRLQENFTKVETPKDFKISLLPHQQVIIRAMLDLEQRRFIRVTGLKASNQIDIPDSGIIETCAGVLSDKLGSGKTYDILGLIAYSKITPMPKTANISYLPIMRGNNMIYNFRRNPSDVSNFRYIGTKTEIRRIYNRYIPLSLIFVSKSVLLQWQKAIVENTGLKVFMIENIFNLKIFYDMIFKPDKVNNIKKLLTYDIILIKNGDVSGRFEPEELKETPLEGVAIKKILTVFGELFKDFCFDRVILDDFDTLGIPNNAFTIPALFTWFVSATKKASTLNNKEYRPKNIQDAICNYRPSYMSVWNNVNLFTFFNISCDEKFVDESTQSSIVDFYSYQFHNNDEQYIGLLGAMGTADAQMVMEALNGDAVNTAAGQVGIKSTSIADIFEKVLDNKWNAYKKTIEIENYITRVTNYIIKLDYSSEHPVYGVGILDKFHKNLQRPGPYEKVCNSIKYNDATVLNVVETVKIENATIKEENGKAINRVKDNLKQGECPITCMPLIECAGVVIMKCCGVTISSEAASWSLKFYKYGSGNVAGICPHCRCQIEFSQLILVDKNLNLEDIINDSVEVPEPVLVETEDPKVVKEEEFNKLSCVISIITGADATDSKIENIRTKRTIHIPSMLVGVYDKGYATIADRKVLVYASYKETLDNLTALLITKNIKFSQIQGTANHINDIVNRYNMPNSDPNSISVLLISGARYCAGLNLQVTTDLIYTHKIIDQNIESQVAGRASRYGRSYNLRIHYVLYDNEIEYMFKNNINRV